MYADELINVLWTWFKDELGNNMGKIAVIYI